jgi:hypothetical protein
MPDNLEQPTQPTPTGQPEGEKIFGKYTNMDEAGKGYFNAVEEMNKTKQQLGMAVQLIEKLQQGQPLATAQAKPEYETQLESYGVPVSAVKALVEAVSKEVAEQAVSSHLTPIASGANARSQMGATYSDYAANEGEVMKYVKSNPQLAQRFEQLLEQNRPYDALEIGYFHWKTSKPVQPAQDPTKVAAGMPNGAGVGTRNPQGMQVGKDERVAQAAEHFFNTKDFSPLFGEVLGDRALTWTEQMERSFGQNR